MGKVKKITTKDYSNHSLNIMLFYDEENLSFVKCSDNFLLENFLSEIIKYLTENNLQQSIEFFFQHRTQKISTRVNGWLAKNVAPQKNKRKKGANSLQYNWPPYKRLVYIIGHYKNMQDVSLDCELNEDKTKVKLKLWLNAKASETYEANIVDENIPAAKDEAAKKILKRLGF